MSILSKGAVGAAVRGGGGGGERGHLWGAGAVGRRVGRPGSQGTKVCSEGERVLFGDEVRRQVDLEVLVVAERFSTNDAVVVKLQLSRRRFCSCHHVILIFRRD